MPTKMAYPIGTVLPFNSPEPIASAVVTVGTGTVYEYNDHDGLWIQKTDNVIAKGNSFARSNGFLAVQIKKTWNEVNILPVIVIGN